MINRAKYKIVTADVNSEKTWTSITAVNENGIFFYDAAHRTAQTATVDGTGTFRNVQSLSGFEYHSHVAGMSNGALVLYDRYSGKLWLERVNGDGKYTTRGSLAGVPMFTLITGG